MAEIRQATGVVVEHSAPGEAFGGGADGLCALQVRVAGHRPVGVFAGAPQERGHQLADRRARGARARGDVHGEVGDHLIVARARGVQAAADRTGQLDQAALDRHVDVFVAGLEAEALLAQLGFDELQPGEQRVAIGRADDLAVGEHARVRARGGDVLRPQPPVEPDRRVQMLEHWILGLVEARHGRSV